jgi:hypothetical protein
MARLGGHAAADTRCGRCCALPSFSTEPFVAGPPLAQGAKAAKRFFKRLLRELQYEPGIIVTDKLKTCDVAHRHLLPKVKHPRSRYLNSRAENSHRPTRRRERQMQGFSKPRPGLSFRSCFHLRPFPHAGIDFPVRHTTRSAPEPSIHGSRTRAPNQLHDRWDMLGPAFFC